MNHICMRRMALTMASLSFSLLILTILGCNIWRVSGIQTAEGDTCAPQEESVVFPYTTADADVIVENIGVYEGIFHEDGTNRQVFDVAAIMLYNSADTVISYIAVEVKTDGERYLFEGFILPPKSRIFIPESNAQKKIEAPVLSCDISVVYLQSRADDAVLIEERNWDTLCITNLSDTTLSAVTIYYHHYLPEDGIYIGGRAFETTIWNLQPGAQTRISPLFYCKGYSKITLVE